MVMFLAHLYRSQVPPVAAETKLFHHKKAAREIELFFTRFM